MKAWSRTRVVHTKCSSNPEACFLNACLPLAQELLAPPIDSSAFQQLSSFLTAIYASVELLYAAEANEKRTNYEAAAAMRPLLSEVAGDWEGQPTHVYCRGPLVH